MKKIAFMLVLIMVSSVLLVGCDYVRDLVCKDDHSDNCGNSDNNDTNDTTGDNGTVETEKTLPTFEELVAINGFEEMFKICDSFYIKNTSFTPDDKIGYVEDIVLFEGDGKINYQMRETQGDGNVILQDASRVGHEWYYYTVSEPLYTVFELGNEYLLDYTLPVLFNSKPIGKAYVDGDYIVHHAYHISEGYEEYPAERIDYTYYFNRDSMLLEKTEGVCYDNQHVVTESFLSEIFYGVKYEDVFDTTLDDKIYNSDKRIDVEIIVGYSTAEQKSYSLISEVGALVFATVNGEMYNLYSDPEYRDRITTLDGFEAGSRLTLYIKDPGQVEQTRYTVTEEEFYAATVERNYTIEQTSSTYHLVHKYTEDALEMEGGIILFIDDKQYSLEDEGGIYVAYDCTDLEFTNAGMLAGGYYEEFTYDETTHAYVCDLMEEMGTRWDIWFEDGVLVRMLVTLVNVVDGVEELSCINSIYTNIGTTVIDVPEFVFEEDYVDPTRRTVTEEEWNLNASVSNFVANFYASSNGEYLFATFISDGNAIEFNGEIIVFENGKRYKLEEIDGVWYAKEWNDFDIFPSFIPSGLSFDDFEYSEEMGSYVLKEKTESGLYYSLSFEDGVLLGFLAQESLDVSDPGYFEMFTFSVAEIGTAVIDVPEYVIVE